MAKGGVSLQLCGWITASELWMGAISDSEYLEKCGILEEQQPFAVTDKVSGEIIAFMNVLDCGYWCDLAAWRQGCQLISQLIFKPSNRKINSREVLLSACCNCIRLCRK